MNFDRDTFVSNPLRFDVYAFVCTCNVLNVMSAYTRQQAAKISDAISCCLLRESLSQLDRKLQNRGKIIKLVWHLG